VVFEHGGGASSVAGDGLMSELRMRGVRTCQYDRLGYGWTPSLVQRGGPNPTSGELLLNLLEVANEASSPMICVGHSAGAAACLEFAIAIANRTAPLRLFGVVMLDGYPDLVRAGSFPGGRQSINVILESLRGFAVMFGPTGLSRGMLGTASPFFTPASSIGPYQALYHQTRFWLAQYYDVLGDTGALICSRLGGSACPDARGVFNFSTVDGPPFRSLRVLHIPAAAINQTLTCAPNSTEYCCAPVGINSSICATQRGIKKRSYRVI